MLQKYSHTYSITAADMDNLYRMTPSAALLYYQDAWARMMSCMSLASFDMAKRNLLWIISEFNVEFTDTNVFWSDDITVETWNSEISSVRLYSDFIFRKTSSGAAVAHGFACWHLLDANTHRLANLAVVQEQIAILPEMTMPTHRKMRFPEGETLIRQITHAVNLINLDFNGHVNNRTYLNIAMQTATEEFLQQNRVQQLSIHWLHETFLGDEIICSLWKTTDAYLHTLTKADGCVVAQIYSHWVAEPNPAHVADEVERK